MRRLTLTLILLGVPWVKAAAPARPVIGPTAYREVLDVRYAPGAGARHTLDVFVPQPGGRKRPVVLFVHGGTWMVGDKNHFGVYRGVGRFLASNGVVAVVPNYRLSPRVKHPEHVKDVARAFAWCRRNAARYGGDPDCIFLAGHSAGGHLVALLATDESYLKDPSLGLDDGARKAIKGVIGLSGVYRVPGREEFRAMAQRSVHLLVGEPGSGRLAASLGPALMLASSAANPFGLVFGKDQDVQAQASPIRHVRAGLPPFLLLNAEREVPGLWRMAADFHAELKKHGVVAELHEVDGATHRTIVKRLHRADNDAAKRVLAFIARLAG